MRQAAPLDGSVEVERSAEMSSGTPEVAHVHSAEPSSGPPKQAALRRDPVAVATRTVVPLLILLGTFVALARTAAAPLDNFDTYFHLRFGHEFLSGWSLRHPGSVTTFATADWVPTQWLPQVVMARTEDWLGLAGVAWLSGLQLCSLALVLYLMGRRWADPVVVAPLVAVALIATSPGLSMRPQVLSYLLVALSAGIWLRARESGRAPWLLVPITWVWAMCHGMWPIGIVIGLVAVVGLALDRCEPRRLLHLLAVPVASAAVAAVTPVGPALYPAVLLVNSRASYFTEWAPPHFTAPNCLALLLLLGVTLVALLRQERTSWFDIAVLTLAGGLAVYSSRTVPVSAALVLPLAAQVLQRLVRDRRPPSRGERVTVLGGYAACLVVLALVVPATASEPPPQPSWVDPALRALPEGTPLIDDSGFGGYLMWRYPDLEIVAHGYGDTFTTAELDRNVAISGLKPGWDDLVRTTGAQYALLPPTSALAYALTDGENWQVVHVDATVELIRAPDGWSTSG